MIPEAKGKHENFDFTPNCLNSNSKVGFTFDLDYMLNIFLDIVFGYLTIKDSILCIYDLI